MIDCRRCHGRKAINVPHDRDGEYVLAPVTCPVCKGLGVEARNSRPVSPNLHLLADTNAIERETQWIIDTYLGGSDD